MKETGFACFFSSKIKCDSLTILPKCGSPFREESESKVKCTSMQRLFQTAELSFKIFGFHVELGRAKAFESETTTFSLEFATRGL